MTSMVRVNVIHVPREQLRFLLGQTVEVDVLVRKSLIKFFYIRACAYIDACMDKQIHPRVFVHNVILHRRGSFLNLFEI